MICPVCGSNIPDDSEICSECGTVIQHTEPYHAKREIKTRGVGMCLVLSLVTCGLYDLYWLIKLNDDINTVSGSESDTSGVMVLILTLVTCGVYGWYWMWKMGEKVNKIKHAEYMNAMFLAMSIFGLGIVAYCIMQDTVNKAVSN